MNSLIAVYYELISQEIGSDGKESRKSILSLDYCLEIYLGYKTDFVPGSALTKDDKVSFQDCLLHDRYGLPVYIVNTQTNKFVVLRPDEIDLTEIFHKLIASFVSKAESEKQLTIEILRIILDTIEWDMKMAKTLLTYQRSYSELENLGINIDSPFTTDHDLEILDLCKHGDIVGRAFFASKSPLKQRTMITRIHTFKEATLKTSSCLSFLTM